MINNIKKNIRIYKQFATNRLNDIYATSLLNNLLSEGDYIPITSSSLNPYSLAVILNDIIVNQRKNILECGGGISTVLIARLFKRNNISGQLCTIEEDAQWLSIIQKILEKENLQEYVKFVHAPLEQSNLGLKNTKWYSQKVLDDELKNIEKLDMVIVDGPSAWRKEIELARYPALPYLIGKMNDNFSFYLDDVNRTGEKTILSLWQEKYQLTFSYITDNFAVTKKGQYYETSL